MSQAVVITLVAPNGRAVEPPALARVKDVAGTRSEPRWIDRGAVCDIDVPDWSDTDTRSLRGRLAEVLADETVDWAVQPASGRVKRLFLADMDSTMIGQECIDELADFAGVGAEVAAITERAMAGELDFEGALRARVALLGGLDIAMLQRTFDERITITPGARTLVRTVTARGARAVLVSGGFTYFADRVAAAIGFAAAHANVLEISGRQLTGTVAEPILGREAKLTALNSHCSDLGIGPDQAIAMGDGANDLAMVEAAGLGVACRAKPVLSEQADGHIAHGDLTAVLSFQGYPRETFVDG